MRVLIAYYSRTNTTKKVAEKIAELLEADLEEIKDTKNRKGIISYLAAGREAMKKQKTKLAELSKDPAGYDLVIIGTPVWAWTISTPIRTYIEEQKEKFPEVALLITQGAEPPKQENIFSEMEELLGKNSLAKLHLSTLQVKNDKFYEELKRFISRLHS